MHALQIPFTGTLDRKVMVGCRGMSGRPVLLLLAHGGVTTLTVMMPPVRIPDATGILVDRVQVGRPPQGHRMLLELD